MESVEYSVLYTVEKQVGQSLDTLVYRSIQYFIDDLIQGYPIGLQPLDLVWTSVWPFLKEDIKNEVC